MSRFFKIPIAISVLAFVAACGGADGADGADGTDGADGASCTATDNGDGTYDLNCNGTIITVSDGTDGTDGTDGESCTATDNGDGTYDLDCNGTVITVSDGTDITSGKGLKNLELEIIEVKNDNGALAVTFTVADNGNPVFHLTMAPIRMMVNQYYAAANTYDNSVWSQDYLYERGATVGADSRLVQYPIGTYTYTFLETIQDAIANDGADAALNQQIALRISGFDTYNAVNAVYQFTGLPTTVGQVATAVAAPVGNIAGTDACETCHGPRIGGVGHGGGYNTVEYCRNCHTRDDANRVANGTDFMTMIHQVHSAYDRSYGATPAEEGYDFSHVTFPGDVKNCAKCHTGNDGDNWNKLPTSEACGSCHTDIDFVVGTNHVGGAQATNANCQACHSADGIRAKHATAASTPNNPLVPAGAANFAYEINSVTVASDIATVNFAILKDGARITDLHTTYPPTGFTGGPSFLLAYALPQDGIDAPADWNNLGTKQSQPLGVSLASVVSTITAGTVAGTYDVVLSSNPFPAGATMRAVGMNGYFTQTALSLARRIPSVVREVTGDSKRRAIVQVTGCLDCHERLELHGGHRVLAAETDANSPVICVMCHNPNLSSSGNTFDIANYTPGNASSDATIATYGNDPLAWPEATQNFKDLVHGIHSSGMREATFEHVRVRSGNAYSFDWSHVTFPGDPSNCSKCHVGDSYMPNKVPAGALMSTDITGTPTNLAEALAVRTTLPNSDDQVIRPVVSACFGCHNTGLVMAHMNQNGAMLGTDRATMATAGLATCTLCHDTGSLADVSKMHSGLNP